MRNQTAAARRVRPRAGVPVSRSLPPNPSKASRRRDSAELAAACACDQLWDAGLGHEGQRSSCPRTRAAAAYPARQD
jgi:hypothetical protein